MTELSEIISKVVSSLKAEIEDRLKELLETKHLYQSVRINTDAMQALIDGVKNSPEIKQMLTQTELFNPNMHVSRPSLEVRIEIFQKAISQAKDNILESFWEFEFEKTSPKIAVLGSDQASPKPFKLKTICVKCAQCAAIKPPHNPGITAVNHPQLKYDPVSWIIERNGSPIKCQTFVFTYHCQACKKEPLVFMVRREGLKLTLVGRNHFEVPEVPSSLPKEESRYFGGAIVAFNTGSVLPALFMLRTTIEQYMRRVTGVTEKLSGDELADRYATLLPDDFPRKRCPSLKSVYNELSACIHAADADETQFLKSRADIEKHFELLTHFPLVNDA